MITAMDGFAQALFSPLGLKTQKQQKAGGDKNGNNKALKEENRGE